jgi:hypothetical protein
MEKVTETKYDSGMSVIQALKDAADAEFPRSVQISLETGCDYESCAELAFPLHKQLSRGYEVCSVMPLVPVSAWMEAHRTARKRASRAARRGYKFKVIARHERADEIHAINVSMPERQGRPMSSGYFERPSEEPLPAYPCPRHRVTTYGVETLDGVLVAYLYIYRAGELALVSQILGHADHLENSIMYLLFACRIEREASEPGFVVYNRHDSGTDGLRFFKERVGLAETAVEWWP